MRQSRLASHLTSLGNNLHHPLPGTSRSQVATMRQDAFQRLRLTGLPTVADEAWRYTNLRTFDKNAFLPAPEVQTPAISAELDQLAIPDLECIRVVLIDGWISESLSSLNDLPEGVSCRRLKDVLHDKTQTDIVERLRSRARSAEHGFAALNCAIAADGIVLEVQANVAVPRPLEILSLSSRDADDRVNNINHFVSLGTGAQLDIVEHFVSSNNTRHMTNTSIDLELTEASQLRHLRIQNESSDAMHLGNTRSYQQSGSSYSIFSFSLGALLERHEVTQSLNGKAASSELKGLIAATEKQHVDSYTNIIHDQPETVSKELYKSILNDRARSVFHGRIHVKKDAQRTDAQQQNNNLLLSPNAEANTKPQLEIYADDVKCAHGATVGYLDADAIFYLKARGIDEHTAKAMLTIAFAAEVIDQINWAPLAHKHLMYLLKTKFSDSLEQRQVA